MSKVSEVIWLHLPLYQNHCSCHQATNCFRGFRSSRTSVTWPRYPCDISDGQGGPRDYCGIMYVSHSLIGHVRHVERGSFSPWVLGCAGNTGCHLRRRARASADGAQGRSCELSTATRECSRVVVSLPPPAFFYSLYPNDWRETIDVDGCWSTLISSSCSGGQRTGCMSEKIFVFFDLCK